MVSHWRNHYHALLHGFPKDKLKKMIVAGKSMSINSRRYKFFSSSIVGGGIPIALGLALALKKKKSQHKVWLFVGDMTYETGIFHECHKYAKNFNLPLKIVVEDNGFSTNTPTQKAWNNKKKFQKILFIIHTKENIPIMVRDLGFYSNYYEKEIIQDEILKSMKFLSKNNKVIF